MTTLDGGVIIKKGGATPTPPPPSGGDILEGEYYLARPNGWYWKVTIATASSIKFGTAEWGRYGGFCAMFSMTQNIFSAKPYFDPAPNIVLDVVAANIDINNEIHRRNEDLDFLIPIIGFSEMPVTRYLGSAVECDSMYELMKMAVGEEVQESDFEAMMLSEYALQRITKEEYDAMTNKTE